MKSLEIRQKFFDFFIKNKHEKVQSSSLIPAQDHTLLFTNAGMNQFKDLFLGLETRKYKRAVTIQKCMRAGGKHNDLDNVGFTKRHLTFFEMMGNFSFGDYFKKEAIQYAWDFITKDLKIDTTKLHATVFESDDESYDIWHKQIGLPTDRIHRLGAADNFWQMGDTGPCGPCTEIYIDRGEKFECGSKTCAPGCNCDRFLEFWNNVFMQFDRQPNGDFNPLKQTGVDTGMGLERLCAILQDKDSVFEIDLFEPTIKQIEELTNLKYSEQNAQIKAAFHVLCDHIRASCFVIADGCSPSNEGRGYVLRKIIRRAALFEQKLIEKSIFPELADSVISTMSSVYPELKVNEQIIKSILKSEIDKFATNLLRGKNILESYFKESLKTKKITGQQAFKLYDTFGFPIEIVEVAAREQGYTVNIPEFEAEMEKQREQSGKKASSDIQEVQLSDDIKTEFTGYSELQNKSEIIAIIKDDSLVDKVSQNQNCWIITRKTPFFVETGGQVNDKGYVEINGKKAEILNLKKINKAIAVNINSPVELKINDSATSVVDCVFRTNTMKNHTATHLLQAALIQLFGKQIKQSGSVVNPDYLRFDFTFHRNLTPEEIKQVEDLVNDKIRENIKVQISQTTYKDAINKGVIAIFGEKYNPENVRVVDIPGFSAELCGGTHVCAIGDIGCFKITEIGALSAGNRRIVALTGPKAIESFQESFNTVKNLSQEFKIKPEQVIDTVLKQKEQIKNLQNIISKLKKDAIKAQVPEWTKKTELINDIPFLFLELEDLNSSELKEIALMLESKRPGFYFIISNANDSSSFLCMVSEKYKDKIALKDFNAWLKKEHNLIGGGKDLIQGGGSKYDKSLEKEIKEWLEKNR